MFLTLLLCSTLCEHEPLDFFKMAILIKKKEKLDRKFLVPGGTEWSLVGIPQAFKDVVELGFTQFLS